MKLVCVFAYRYEPDWLIDQLKENMAWVDAFVSWDTRDRPEVWVPRAERVAVLQERARRAKADWIISMDVDERMEPRGEKIIRRVLEKSPKRRYRLRFRELWTPTEYRIDGVWGKKTRRKLYHLPTHDADPLAFTRGKAELLNCDVYHLGTIEPESREVRRKVHTDHNTWDNKSRGFDYLDDESGLRLRPIAPDRMYSPAYRRYVREVPGYGT